MASAMSWFVYPQASSLQRGSARSSTGCGTLDYEQAMSACSPKRGRLSAAILTILLVYLALAPYTSLDEGNFLASA